MAARTDLFGRRDFLRWSTLGAGGLRAGPAAKGELNCILLWLSGGMSHLDTFDMKPDAPREIRGEFRAIRSNVPGVRICEHLPRTAKIMDKVTVLRSMTSTETGHERATSYLLSGSRPRPDVEFPAMGSVVARIKGPRGAPPPYVTLPAALPGCGAGDLGRAYNPCLAPAPGREPRRVGERYGDTPTGQGALRARQLVEDGARFVTVANGWLRYDTHGDHFNTCKNTLLPEFDQAFAALVGELEERGLLETTLVMAMGEFGRTPAINEGAGRDHHAKAWSAVFAGGGMAGGRVLGATDATGTSVTELPVTPEDLMHTLYCRLGIDPRFELTTADGRRVPLVAGGRTVPALFA